MGLCCYGIDDGVSMRDLDDCGAMIRRRFVMSYGFKIWVWFRDGSVEVFRNIASVYAYRDDIALISYLHDVQLSYPTDHIEKLEVFSETEFAEVFNTLSEKVL